jgi:hypothetical protein
MNPLYKQLIRSSIFGTLILCLLLFIPAGTLHYWQGWASVATFVICSAAYTVYLAKHDPALLKRRTEAGISHEKETTQKVVIDLLFTASIALVVLPPLDVRFGWSNVPWYVCAFGAALVAVSFYLFYLVSKVNTYAAANIRVEEGQKVISTGMYGFCPASDVFRGAVPAHRNSARARVVVDAALDPDLPADPYRAHFERREGAYQGSAGIRGVSKEGYDKAHSLYLVEPVNPTPWLHQPLLKQGSGDRPTASFRRLDEMSS